MAPQSIDHRAAAVEYLKSRISAVRLPAHWAREGIAEPTSECRDKAFEIARSLFEEYGWIPYKVAASAQEGLYLAYLHPHSGRTLGIEVDNELDAVGVVADDRETIQAGPWEDAEMDELIEVFSAVVFTFSCQR